MEEIQTIIAISQSTIGNGDASDDDDIDVDIDDDDGNDLYERRIVQDLRYNELANAENAGIEEDEIARYLCEGKTMEEIQMIIAMSRSLGGAATDYVI